MVLYVECDNEPDTFINFVPVYKHDLTNKHNNNNENFLFDFHVHYTKVNEPDSDGDEDLDYDNLPTRTNHESLVFPKDWLFGGDEDCTQAIVTHILYTIQVPSYREIVLRLTHEILELKKRDVLSILPKVEKIEVDLEVTVLQFPGEFEEEEHVDVRLAVAPASDEAVEKHFETVVVEEESCCVICMDTIAVGSDMEAGRMSCMHVFHRTCGVDWLKSSGICPVCRAEFPS